VRLLNPSTGQLLREHLRQARGGDRIQDSRPPKHTPLSTQPTAVPCRPGRRADRRALPPHAPGARETAVRRILGMLSLAKKYGAASVDEACATALEVGSCECRFVRRYLERHPQMPLSL
jgi:hypothetical protein